MPPTTPPPMPSNTVQIIIIVMIIAGIVIFFKPIKDMFSGLFGIGSELIDGASDVGKTVLGGIEDGASYAIDAGEEVVQWSADTAVKAANAVSPFFNAAGTVFNTVGKGVEFAANTAAETLHVATFGLF